MASKNIKGLTVEIGGDTTQLGKALEDVNKKSKDLSSELGQINKLLKLDPSNIDLLVQKQKVLDDALWNTAKKLETMKEAEKQVQEQFANGDATADQIRELQREIIATTNQLKSYERAVEETVDEIKKLENESEGAADSVEETAEAAEEAAEDLDDLAGSADKFGDKLKAAGSIAASALAAVGAAVAAAGAALGKATVDAAAYADEILTQSIVTGVSTEKLQAYSYAAELVDVSVETMTKSMGKNIKSMKSATDGSRLYVEAYDKLGVSVTDANGNMRDSETVYWEAIDALGKMTNETERDALSMQLFGKSAQELNPLIEAGADKMRELTEEAKAVGAVMSDESLEALGAYDDSLQRLKGSADAAKNSLGTVLLPEMQKLNEVTTEVLTEFTTKLNESGGGLEGFVSVLSGMAEDIGTKAGDLLGGLLEKLTGLLPSLVGLATSLVSTLVTSIVSALPQFLDMGVQIILTVVDGLTQAIPQLAQAIPQVTQALVTGLIGAIPQLLEGAIQFLLAIVQAVPVLIEQLAPQVPLIVETVVSALASSIPVLLEGAVQLLNAIIEAIPVIIESLVPQVPAIVEAIIAGLSECLPLLLDASIELLMAIVEAIPEICVLLAKETPLILDAILKVLGKLPELLWTILESVLKGVGVWDDQMAKDAKAAAKKFLDNAINTIKELPGKIWTWLKNATDKVITWGSDAAAKAKTAAKNIFDAVVNGIKNLPSKLASIGSDMVKGLWNGINDMVGWVTDKIQSFGSGVLDGIKSFFGIASPSRVFRDEVGKMLAEGLAVGVEKNADKPLDAIADLSQDMLDEADSLNGLTLERRLRHTFAGPEEPNAQAGMLDKLDQILTAIQRGQILTLDGKALVGATAEMTDSALGQRRALAARGAV